MSADMEAGEDEMSSYGDEEGENSWDIPDESGEDDQMEDLS